MLYSIVNCLHASDCVLHDSDSVVWSLQWPAVSQSVTTPGLSRSSGPSQGLSCHRGCLMSVDSGPRLQSETLTSAWSPGIMCCMLQGVMQCHIHCHDWITFRMKDFSCFCCWAGPNHQVLISCVVIYKIPMLWIKAKIWQFKNMSLLLLTDQIEPSIMLKS